MGEIKIEIPEDIEQRMLEFPEIDWPPVIKKYIKEEVLRLIRLKSIIAKSKFTEKDAEELGRKINKALAKRYRES